MPKRQLLFSAAIGVTWAPPGHLLYARDDKLIAQGFDAGALKLRGEPVTLDGRWIAYNSNESGQFEAYVQSFPVAGGKYQVTNGGGVNFGWSRDGKQLYYGLNSDPGIAYAAEVKEGAEFQPGRRATSSRRPGMYGE